MPHVTVRSVESYERTDAGVRFDVSLERDVVPELTGADSGRTTVDRTVPVWINFYNPSTFRFAFHANPEAETDGRLVEIDEAAIERPVDLAVEERNGSLVLSTDELTVTVGLDPWRFTVAADERTLFAERRDDDDVKGRPRVRPLGFTEREVTNWPYAVSDVGTSFALDPDESVFGLGEQFTGFDKRGQSVSAWVTQPNGTATEDAYKNVPLFYSTRGYGLFVDTTERVDFDFGDTSVRSGTIDVHDDALELVFVYGPDFESIHREYTALTGRPARPPKWSFGIWMSRYGYETREELEAVTDRLRDEQIPCDVVHLDPYWMRDRHYCDLEWDTEAFPDPEGLIDDLHDRGFHLSLWEHPYLTVGTEAFEEAKDEGYLVTDGTGDPYVLDRLSISTYRGGILDVTDPDARDWWKAKHHDLVELGVDVFKTDFGEYLPEDAVFANGRSGASMRNAYPHIYQRTVHEAMCEAGDPDDALLFSRSGWYGTQRFPVHWPGDPLCTFESMAAALRGGLSLGLSGYAYWAHDVGGFKGEPSEELYVRWAQFGLLSSHTRFHGTTPREPWEFGDRAAKIVREYADLRYRLLPYLYSYAEQASRTGLPMMRPLVLHHQHDPAVHDLGDQFLLGEELLVAPVTEPGGRVSVYLPDGEWVDFFTDERHEGGQTLHPEVALDELPLYVRAGGIVPMREGTHQTVPGGTPDRVRLRCTLAGDGGTDATFPFLDEDATTVEEIAMTADGDGDAVTFSLPDGPSFVAELRAVREPPDTVQADGTRLERVTDNPETGEWTYDSDDDVLVAELT